MKKIQTSLLLIIAMMVSVITMAQSIEDGRKFMYYERFQSAKEIFQKLINATPNNEEAIYWLGQAEIGLENLPAAKSLYQSRLSAVPNSPLVLAGMGHLELLEGKTQDARNRFETAISLSQGKSIAVLNAVGFANGNPDSKNGDAAYAIEKLKQATQVKGFKDPEVWANLGDAYRKITDGGNAITAYNAALAINPNYARALFRSGRVYQTQGAIQTDLFMRYYNDAIAKDPNYAPVYNNLFNYYYDIDVNKSAQYLDKYLAVSDADPKACYYRASMKYAQGLFAQAISKADECIGREGVSPYPNLFGIKALAYNRLHDSLNAKASYDEYFKRQDPNKIGGGDYSSYAAILLKFPGNEELAGTYVEKAVALDTIYANKVIYLKSIASAYDNQKKYADAAKWYSKIINVKSNYSNVDLFNAGYAYYLAGKNDSSMRFFDLYVNKYPEDILGYYMLGNANAAIDSTGELGLAVPYYTKVVEIGEADPTKANAKTRLLNAYKFFIGYYYNNKKDRDNALLYLNKGLALEPTDANLLANKEFITNNDPKAPPKKAAAPSKPAKPAKSKPGKKK
ncbi:MAG: tetratricopeptide repeat protein [Ferruginibacter sp.]